MKVRVNVNEGWRRSGPRRTGEARARAARTAEPPVPAEAALARLMRGGWCRDGGLSDLLLPGGR